MGMIGHPFTALILANLIAWYVLGISAKTSKEALFENQYQIVSARRSHHIADWCWRGVQTSFD